MPYKPHQQGSNFGIWFTVVWLIGFGVLSGWLVFSQVQPVQIVVGR